MKSLLTLSIISIALTGCTTLSSDIAAFKQSTIQTVNLPTPFDPEQAAFILEQGSATITGTSTIKDSVGEVITCAGNNVYLVPVNEYSRERFTYLFGGSAKGFSPDEVIRKIKFKPDPPEFRKYMRVGTCNYIGQFSFKNVPAGRYYIGTNIISEIDGYNTIDGGAYAKEITLKKGQSLHISLD